MVSGLLICVRLFVAAVSCSVLSLSLSSFLSLHTCDCVCVCADILTLPYMIVCPGFARLLFCLSICVSVYLCVCPLVCQSLYLSVCLSVVLSHSPRTNWMTSQTIHLSTILVPKKKKNAQTAAPPAKKPVGIISFATRRMPRQSDNPAKVTEKRPHTLQ